METASWIEEAKHAMNEELAAAEELSKWMRCQRSRRRQQRTNELVTAPAGTPRTISQALQQGRGPGSAPLSPHSKSKQVAWMEPWGAGTVGAVAAAPGVASAVRVSVQDVPRFAPDDSHSESMSFEPVLDLGMRVLARFLASEPKEKRRKKAGANKWWRGTIVAVHVGAGGFTYDVEYDDKVIEQGVHARFVQRLDEAEPIKEPKEPAWPVEPMERAKVHRYDLAASTEHEQLPDFGLQQVRISKVEAEMAQARLLMRRSSAPHVRLRALRSLERAMAARAAMAEWV